MMGKVKGKSGKWEEKMNMDSGLLYFAAYTSIPPRRITYARLF